MRTLGRRGRFGNQIFQYAFLKIYAKIFNLEVATPSWVGQKLFGANDPKIHANLPVVRESKHPNLKNIFTEPKPRFINCDFAGYFQFHTKYYAPYKDYFLSLFVPIPEVEEEMKKGLKKLYSKGRTIVGIHIRRGDYTKYKNSPVYYSVPIKWYKDWLKSIWSELDHPVLYIASDDIKKIAPEFSEYNPVTTNDIFEAFLIADFYPDFYVLTQCNYLAISNSTFSFSASMLNNKANTFMRPTLKTRKLIPFNPWNSPPKLGRYGRRYR